MSYPMTNLTLPYPSLSQWHDLYTAVNQFAALAPWRWLKTEQLIGIQPTNASEPNFVSLEVAEDDTPNVLVYLGADGLYRWRHLQSQPLPWRPEQILNVPHLIVSWESRQTLTSRDRAIIQELGLRYRGRQAWPMLRSTQPGYAPWYLTAVEADLLTITLQQTAVLARTLQGNGYPTPPQPDHLLVQIPGPTPTDPWQTTWQQIAPPAPRQYRIPIDPLARAHLHETPQTMSIVDIGFYWMPSPVGGRNERPSFPYSLILMEPSTGLILGHELMVADPTPVEMWSSIPLRLIQALAKINLKPKTLRTADGRLQPFLNIIAQEYDMDVKIVPDLPQLDALQRGLIGFVR
jgi:hypothetical protein